MMNKSETIDPIKYKMCYARCFQSKVGNQSPLTNKSPNPFPPEKVLWPGKKVSQIITTEGVEQGLINVGSYKDSSIINKPLTLNFFKYIFQLMKLPVFNLTGQNK